MVAQTYMTPRSYAAAIPEGNFKTPTTASMLQNAQMLGGQIQDYQTRRDTKALGEAMAGIPEAESGSRVVGDTEQSAALAEQTADFADEPGGIPDQEVEALQSAGQTRVSTTTKDWKSWEDKIMQQAAKLGPEAVQKAQMHIAQTQQASFEKDAVDAMKLMQTNPQAAARALERAYSNMPDGSSAQISVGPDGNLSLQLIDEETGKPEGDAESVDQQDIAEFIEMSRDPVAWSAAVTAGREATLKTAEETRQFNEELKVKQDAEARLSGSAGEVGRHNLATEGLKGDELKQVQAQNKVTNALNEKKQQLAVLKQELEGRKHMAGGTKRAAEVRKLEAEIKLNQAKANYYNAGGTQKNEASFFKKRNDLLQRLNTASAGVAAAEEAMARAQRYNEIDPEKYPIGDAVQKGYDRELAKYQMITDMWDELDREELAKSGAPPAAAVEQQAAIPAEGTAPAAAIELLRSNPTDEMKEYFKQQFGYLPDTI